MTERWICPLCGGGNAPLSGECYCRVMNRNAQNNLPQRPIITSIMLKPDPGTGLIFGRFIAVKRKSDGAVGLFDTKQDKLYRIDGATGKEKEAAT